MGEQGWGGGGVKSEMKGGDLGGGRGGVGGRYWVHQTLTSPYYLERMGINQSGTERRLAKLGLFEWGYWTYSVSVCLFFSRWTDLAQI